MAKPELTAAIEKHGITVESVFIPFSQSRNAKTGHDGKPWLSLNWKVTIKRHGRDILTTDYSAGSAHCPSYHKPVPKGFSRPAKMWQPLVTEWECENGYPAELVKWGYGNEFRRVPKSARIDPDAVDVVWSLMLDANVLDYSSFEEWANEYGYDADSRKAEGLYRDCLAIALKLRAGFGESAMAELAEASADY